MKIKKVLILALTLFMMCDMNNSIEAINSLNKSRINDFKVQLDDNELLMKSEIPDAIEYNNVIDKGHCKRVIEEEESLNSIVFKNTDGTHSRYIFNYPVKYIDEHGNVQDKSLEIKEDKKTNSYISDSSDISATFNKDLNSGVQLEYENIDLKMIPNFNISENSYVELSDDKKNISYSCHNNISLEYSLTYQGIKEDIILNKYSGINKFSFTLLTNGLKLDIDEDKNYNLYDSNGLIRANIGEIVIYDSANNMCIGSLVSKTIKENTEYLLEISVDETFLTDSETVFPVYIDPTIEIDYEHYGSNLYDGEPAISYSTIYSDNKVNNNGTIVVGKSGTRTARTLIKFPGLINEKNKKFLFVDPAQIQSAKIYLRDIGYHSDRNAMNIYCFKYDKEWGQNDDLNWYEYANDYSNELSFNLISHSNGIIQDPIHTYAFDITPAVQSWCTGATHYNCAYGIIFKADDLVENGDDGLLYASFGSYKNGYYSPYLVIDYKTPYNYKYAENVPISYTYNTTLNLNEGEKYIFQTEKATDYPNCDTELYLFKTDITEELNYRNYTWFNDDMSNVTPINRYSKIEVTIPVSGSYKLMAKCYDPIGKDGLCTKGYCNIYKINYKTQEKVLLKENAQLGGYRMALPSGMKFSTSKYNSFTTNINNCDPVMYILGENETQRKVIGYNDDYKSKGDYNWGKDARVKQNYILDKPRYIFVSSFSLTSGKCDIYGMCEGMYSSYNFPNLNEDDGIKSAPGSLAYNCISYSGGITIDWVDPITNVLSPWYNINSEQAFDNFYGNNPPRYSGAMTYTETTNEDEAVINLYKNGDSWTHASVRKPANEQLHGYSWESKLGSSYRIFHTLNSLNYDNPNSDKAYGHIEKRYKIADSNINSETKSNYILKNEITYSESLKSGLTKIQNINITKSENMIIKNKVKNIKSEVTDNFNFLYYDWIKNSINDEVISLSSFSSNYTKTIEYEKLSEFIDGNDELVELIISMYLNDSSNVFIITLFNDKVVCKNEKSLKIANSIRENNNIISYASENSDTYVAPTFDTNARCFIKEILKVDFE